MGDASFWNNNPFVPRWLDTLSGMWAGAPPKLLESATVKRSVKLPPGAVLRLAEPADTAAIVEFWGRYFSITKVCRCAVSKGFLLKAILSGRYQVLLAVASQGQVIGTVVRRRLQGLRVYEARWAAAAAIDFFCVHPSWRGRGIGRSLLDTIHNLSSFPIAPHLILWEGLRPSVPPLAVGWFWMRRAQGGAGEARRVTDPQEIQAAWKRAVAGADVWTEEPGEEITVWDLPEGKGIRTVVWNTLHVTVPEGLPIGIVLSDIASADALASAKSPWGVLLLGQGNPIPQGEWTLDSAYQWIGYNLSIGRVSRQFPRIGF